MEILVIIMKVLLGAAAIIVVASIVGRKTTSPYNRKNRIREQTPAPYKLEPPK